MGSWYQSLRPLLFKMDPESAHELVHSGLQLSQLIPGGINLLRSTYSFQSSRLEQNIGGLKFVNPIGLAAGFDKNARLGDAMSALGFGFLELGSVTNQACMGNEKPRLFRLPEDEALINRLGLNNHGPLRFLENLERLKTQVPKLISISKTNNPELSGDQAIEDFSSCYQTVGAFADAVVFNLSCPNTKDGKTFEDIEALRQLLGSLMQVRKQESFYHLVFVKFSSDVELDYLRKLLDVSLENGVDGFVLSNTSNRRDFLKTNKSRLVEIGRGGLSGKPIFEKSLERVKLTYQHTGGKLPIIGVGGVSNSIQAIKMIKSGASLVELYTALVYKGPVLIREILEGVEKELSSLNLMSVSDLIGSEVKSSS